MTEQTIIDDKLKLLPGYENDTSIADEDSKINEEIDKILKEIENNFVGRDVGTISEVAQDDKLVNLVIFISTKKK